MQKKKYWKQKSAHSERVVGLSNTGIHSAKATLLLNTRGSANQASLSQSKLLHSIEGDKVPVAHIKNRLGKSVCVIPASDKSKSICGSAFAQGSGRIWWVIQEDGEVHCVPQGDFILGKNSQ